MHLPSPRSPKLRDSKTDSPKAESAVTSISRCFHTASVVNGRSRDGQISSRSFSQAALAILGGVLARSPVRKVLGRSGRPSDNGLALIDDPVMGYAARRGVLLGLQQPMQSLGRSELDTDCIALSTVNRLDRLAPAQAACQFYREHPAFPRPFD